MHDALFLPEAGQAENALGHRVVHLRVHRDGDVFFHAQLAEKADILECARDARAVDLRGVEVMDVFAVQENRAVGGLIDLGEQVEDRRLTGTVRADEAGDLGATDGHIEVVDRFQTAERDAEVDALEHGGLVRVALGEQRRFTGDGNELGFFFLCHGQSSFSALAR